MKYTTKYLKQLLAENNIKFSEARSKLQLLFQLFDAGILTREDAFPPKEPKLIDFIDPKYEYLRTIRKQPKKVTYIDTETGEAITYDSIYKASKARKRAHGFYLIRNRQDGKYMVTVE